VRRSNQRSNIVEALQEADAPLTPSQIAEEVGMKPNNVKQRLRKIVTDGEVEKDGYGKYRYPGNSGHSDNSAGKTS
jgi:predicted transcriptional regulator